MHLVATVQFPGALEVDGEGHNPRKEIKASFQGIAVPHRVSQPRQFPPPRADQSRIAQLSSPSLGGGVECPSPTPASAGLFQPGASVHSRGIAVSLLLPSRPEFAFDIGVTLAQFLFRGLPHLCILQPEPFWPDSSTLSLPMESPGPSVGPHPRDGTNLTLQLRLSSPPIATQPSLAHIVFCTRALSDNCQVPAYRSS